VIQLLCLDAGGTVVFLDHERVARIVGVSSDALARAEGVMKRKLETGEVISVEWSGSVVPGFAQWGKGMATMLDDAGIARAEIPRLLEALRAAHLELNLWSRVPEGLKEAVVELRETGVKVGIVSNSEGSLDKLLARLGILEAFDFVLDSAVVGVEKPDPGIFRIALDRTKIAPDRALHVGDVYAMDVVGARAAGVHPALIDPLGHYSGRHGDVPRVESVSALAKSLVVAPGPTYLQLTAKKVQS
jgi:putative hydrolase of the HAD superfamily